MVTDDRRELVQRLLAAHGSHVLAYTRRLVGAAHAEEIVQEAFLRLWQAPIDVPIENPKAWLFTVCRRLGIDHLRKAARLQLVDPRQLAASRGSETAVQPEAGDTMDQTQAVDRMLAPLSAQQQEAVRLKFLHDHSYKEIAQIMGISVSHVGVLLHQALKRVRALQTGGAV